MDMRRTTALLLSALSVQTLNAAESPPPEKDLTELSLEMLMDMDVTITSASKREQKLGDAATAITVLSNEDIRRSGATSIPEALRLVPGLDVAQFNSSQWAISARGFDNVYANVLLVLVDGRTVYSPVFAGVYWDMQQSTLDDIDRIEVIRGPGGTIWGANAVNGVVNVVTRSAKDTQGAHFFAGGGDVHTAMGGARYGGQLGGDTYYRVFAEYQTNDDFEFTNGASAHDHWEGKHAGFRLDHHSSPNTLLTWQTEATRSDLDDHAGASENYFTLGRWTHSTSERSGIEVQAYYDRSERSLPTTLASKVDTFDLTFQQTLPLGKRNDVIWGAGFRQTNRQLRQTFPFFSVPSRGIHQGVVNFFVQDEFHAIPDKLTLTAGLKIEHNKITHSELQPSLRLLYKPAAHHSLWAAVSRAVGTPSDFQSSEGFGTSIGGPIAGPGGGLYIPQLSATPDLHSMYVWAYEAGYRLQSSRRVQWDFATFLNHYERIVSSGDIAQFVPGTPFGIAVIPYQNILNGDAYGGEASMTFNVSNDWRLTATYSLQITEINGAEIFNPRFFEIGNPTHQAMVRSSHDIGSRMNFDVLLRYVDNFLAAPAYLTADARLAYRPSEHWEFALVGQNLFDPQHAEHGAVVGLVPAVVPRGFYGKFSWRF